MEFLRRYHGLTIAKSFSIPIVILASAIGFALYQWAVFLTTFDHPGLVGPLNWNAPGQDWMVIYSAARSLIDHHASLMFDGERLTSYINETFSHWLSEALSHHPFLYPPSFLLLVVPFAYLGFPLSYALFQLMTAGGLWYALARNADQPKFIHLVSLSALVSPAAAITVITGQITFFVTICLVAGMRAVEKRPVLAAFFLSLLSLKPQFFLLVPLALLAARQWRCLFYLAAFCALLVILSGCIFGIDVWNEWIGLALRKALVTDHKWMEEGRRWGNSVFACALGFGLSSKVATCLQMCALLLSAAFVYRAYRSVAKPDQKLAILLAASVLGAPHSGPYDGVLLVVAAMLWLVEEKPAPGKLIPWAFLLALWMIPIFSPPYFFIQGRFAPLIVIIFMVQVSLSALNVGKPATLGVSADTP